MEKKLVSISNPYIFTVYLYIDISITLINGCGIRRHKMLKTNAMRILDKEKIDYNVYTDDSNEKQVNGVAVAEKIGKDVNQVYKTLVTKSKTAIYIFVIPVHMELDFKKAAEVTKEKKIELTDLKDIMQLTGYVRGGCSPLGMKKTYLTYIQEDSIMQENIVINAGKLGVYLEISPKDLAKAINGVFADIIK